jgi:hypothetical protein
VKVGDHLRIERDETRYPSKGTWPSFRGTTGTIVEFNLGEVGVCFTKVTPRTDGRGNFRYDTKSVAWFQPYEVAPAYAGRAPQTATEHPNPVPEIDDTRELANA